MIKTAGAAELGPSPMRFPISSTPRLQLSLNIPYSDVFSNLTVSLDGF